MKLKYKNIAGILYSISLILIVSSSCSGFKSNEKSSFDHTNGGVTIYTTTSDLSSDLSRSNTNLADTPSATQTTITLDPTTRYQTMDGFGTAITGSSCFNLLKMTKEDRDKFLTETFSESEGFGHSYIRISIGCSDFSLSEYTCCDKEGIENFSLQNEELDYVIPILKEIQKINPNIKILGSPWTSPRWMKVNNLTELKPFNSWTSGHLNPKYYEDYGTYFVKWILAMKDHGINIDAITPQNEPLNRGNSASLFMGWEEQRDFIKKGLGPKLKEAGLNTKIYLFDHNYNYDNMADQNDYPIRIYEDAEATSYVTGAAYHNYGGDKKELLDIQSKKTDKELIFTETSIGTWNDGRNLDIRLMSDMQEVALGTINNWCKAVIVWNMMLDSERGPNREGGCQTCYGAVDIDRSDYKTITRNSHYYIISHLSSVIKPNATRIGTKGYTTAGLTYAAFENTDGTYAVVLQNDNSENINLSLNDGANSFEYNVPSKAVISFRWKNNQ